MFSRGVAQRDEIQPPRAPRAPGRRAELAAARADLLAGLVVQLRREGPGADARRVGLGHAPDLLDVARADAGADARGAGHRVRRGHEGIRAVVDVEHRRLGALEDNPAAVVERAVGERRGVGDVALEPVPEGEVLLGHRLEVQPRVAGEGRRLSRLGSSAAAIFFRIFSSSMSCTRMPRRAALSA